MSDSVDACLICGEDVLEEQQHEENKDGFVWHKQCLDSLPTPPKASPEGEPTDTLPFRCRICDGGYLSARVLHYSVCGGCGSEQADAAQMQINKALNAKQGADITELVDALENVILESGWDDGGYNAQLIANHRE